MRIVLYALKFSFLISCSTPQVTEEKTTQKITETNIVEKYVRLNESFKRNKSDVDSTYFSVKYPLIKLNQYASDSIINDRIFEDLKISIAGRGRSTIKKQMKDFVSDYKRFIDRHDDYKHNWTSQFNVDVSTYIPPLVVIKREMLMYTGGSHPNFGYAYQNFDAETGKELKLEDIFVSNFESQLEKIAENAFKKQYKIDGALNHADFTFPRNKFFLPEEFSLLHNSLHFVYPLYAVAPYAKGSIHFQIPYSDLAPILKSNSIIHKISK